MTVTINGTTGIAGTNGSAGTPAVQGDDTNTGIFFPAADTVAVATGGTERVRVGSSGNVGIGITTPASPLHVYFTDATTYGDGTANLDQASLLTVSNGSQTNDTYSGIRLASESAAGTVGVWVLASVSTSSNYDNHLVFHQRTGSATYAERARFDDSGNFYVGATAISLTSTTDTGSVIAASSGATFLRASGTPLQVMRQTNDGTLIDLRQGGASEGTISVSGTTVSYNPFLGSHSGALADWSRPDIKIGTVMDTIDDLLDYKVVVIDIQEDATTQAVQKRICYNGNGAIGSNATVEYEGQEYTGIIQDEREEPHPFNKHLKVKVNDTAGSKAVFGVFVSWGTDETNDGGVYNDMLVGAVGNYVIRMAAGQEPQIGDLVEADGNGCGVVQDDDIIRTKTVAKITSTIKQVTYDDGSFLVTCVLYCG
jgi:hypothetical protein